MIQACEAELRLSPDDRRAGRLHHEIARTHETELGDPAAARRHYRLALERAPEHIPSIRAARRLAERARDYKDTIRLLDEEIRLEPDSHRRAFLQLAKGRQQEDLANQLPAAIESYATAASLDPTNLTILGALVQAQQTAGAWEELSEALGRTASAIPEEGPHRAALVARRARVEETKLDRGRQATELYEYALRMDARAGGALQALKRLLLEQERWQELISVLGRELQQSQDPEVKTMALYRIARIFAGRLGDREQAIRALNQAAEISPTDHLVLDELARLLEAADDTAALAGVLERLVGTIEVPTRRLSLINRVAQLHADRLEDADAAIRWHETALKIDPTYVPALRALSRLYTARKSWAELVRMYVDEAGATRDSRRRAAAHARIAEIMEAHLEEPGEAAEHHAKALALAPELESSFKALARLYAAAGRHGDLVQLYERQIDRAEQPDVAITYLLKIGSLLEDALDAPGDAIDAYRRVLRKDPRHLGAIHALQRSAAAAAKHEALVEALELEVEEADDGRTVELLHRAGQVLDEHLGRSDAALTRYKRVLTIDPAHRPCLASLGRLYHRLGRWSDLLDVYEQELLLEEDREKKVRMYMRMAEIAEQELADPARTLGFLRSALELDPASIPVLHALAHRLHERQDWTELVDVLQIELRGLTDAEDVAAVAYQLGTVLEQQLGDLDAAVNAYRKSVKAVPRYRPALDALARLHARQEVWSSLVDLLKKEASELRDPALAIEALLRSGEILGDRMSRDEMAIEPYEAIRSQVPGNLAALVALEPLYRRTRKWTELAELYRAQAESFQDPGARAAALVEVARVLMTHGGTEDTGAAEALLKALEHQPRHELALDALETLAQRAGDPTLLARVNARRLAGSAEDPGAPDHYVRLARILETNQPERAAESYKAAIRGDGDSLAAIRGLARLAEQSGDRSAMAEALRAEAAWTRQPERAAELLVQAARLTATELGDPEGAIADLELALERHPSDVAAAEELMELLRAGDDLDRLLVSLTRAAQGIEDPARVAEVWRDIALIHADDLNDLPLGIAALERATAADGTQTSTLSELARLYGRNGQWREAANALERVVELGPRRGILADVHLRLARILVEQLDDRPAGEKQLDALLRMDGNNVEGLALLLELHARNGDFKAASSVGKRLLNVAPEGTARSRALLAVGNVQLRAGERAAAAETLREAVSLSGPSSEAATAYRELLGTDEPWEAYARALVEHRMRVESGDSDAPLHETLLELARVLHEQLNDHEGALRTLREGLVQHPEERELHASLAERLRVTGRHAEAVEANQTFIGHHPTAPTAWRGLAATFQALGRDVDAALAVAPLIVLGEATDAERRLAAKRKLRPGLARERALAREGLRTISAGPAVEEHVENVLLALADPLSKLFPPDLDAYGVGSRDRLGPRDEHPIRALCDRMAPVFGLERFDVFVHRRNLADVVVELSFPAAIMVPESLLRRPEPQQVFFLARAMTNLTRGVHPVAKLGGERAGHIVAAAARGASPSFGRGQFDEGALDETRKRLVKAASWRGRKALDEAAEGLVSMPRLDMKGLARDFALTANRAAALLAGDLNACIDVIRTLDPELAEATGAVLVHQSDPIQDLLRFWASRAAIDFRHRAGLT